VDLETDKVVLEVPAPQDGVMGEILKEDGATVVGGDLLGMLEKAGAKAKSKEAPAAPAPEKEHKAPAASEAPESRKTEEALSPAVRRLVVENELDPSKITGTGRGGRITKEDVLGYLDQEDEIPPAETDESESPAPEAPASPERAETDKPPAAKTEPPSPGERPERRVPMSRLRQRIAERLVEVQQTAAILTTFNEVNMQPVMELRSRYKDRFEKAHETRLGFMSFFVKASIEALKRFPAVNASIDGSDIIYHGYHDIGIAVSSPRGLVVPVLRNAEDMSFAEIEATIAEYGGRARDGKLTIEELTGGTFSITNGGIFGSLMSTPILNPPQSAILGMHKIQERPMAEGGQVVVRPMMYLALSYDHRIVDGREAVQFLVTIKETLEDPARMLLEV